MIDLAIDPSETRPAAVAPQRRNADRPWGRIALFGVLGLAGTGAFAAVANTYLSGLAGPQRAPVLSRQKAADWPDLKDGMPALATGSVSAVPKVREILPSEPAPPAVVEARAEPTPRTPSAAASSPATPSAMQAAELKPIEAKPAAAVTAAKPMPAAVDVPVIGPSRQANLVAPARTVAGIAPLAAETVRAKTVSADSGGATFAALPPEKAKPTPIRAEPAKSEAVKPEATKPEPVKAKPRIEAHAKPPAVEKSTARKPVAVEAKAAPVEAQDEDTEVFGIKVPSLAPAGRKIRESVEALGDAVKGIPDRF